MPQFMIARQRGRRALGMLVALACCTALRDANAERITRGGRCTAELEGVARRGAVQLEHLAEPAWETMAGNFEGRGIRLHFEAQIHNGTGTGRMWDKAKHQGPMHIEVALRHGGFTLRRGPGFRRRVRVQGAVLPARELIRLAREL
jgi:hypothetical protein